MRDPRNPGIRRRGGDWDWIGRREAASPSRGSGGSFPGFGEFSTALEKPFTSAAPYESHLPDTPARRERLYTQARARLSGIAEERKIDRVEATTEVRSGSATEEIVTAAIDYGAD